MLLDSFQSLKGREEVMVQEEVAKPEIRIVEADDRYGKFALEPLERGYGTTLGNPLRRVLLGSLPGAAITWVKIEKVLHEYTSMPHVKEEVSEFLLNVKGIRLRSLSDRPGKLRLELSGEGMACAGDIMVSSDFEIVNPEHHLATMDSSDSKLSVEFNVEQGKGYVIAEHSDGLPIGVLPVDAIFTPVRKVNYSVEHTRVGQATDYERLLMEVWTDGTITPVEAVRKAASILVEQFFLFSNVGKGAEAGKEGPPLALTIPVEQYNTPVERLDLSSRTLNCLKRANINKVGEILEMDRSDLLKIRNFGEKSLHELFSRLEEMGFLPEGYGQSQPTEAKSEVAEEEATEPEDQSTEAVHTEETSEIADEGRIEV